MIRIDKNNPFTALWNKRNDKLNPDNDSIWGRLARKAKNLVFYIPNSIVAASFNPRGGSKFYPFSENRTFTKEIITPDNVHLRACVNTTFGVNSKTPTVILFNPLGANDSVHSKLTDELSFRGCNVVTFNYRGLGTTWRAEDLVVDGESVYQYVTKELGTVSNKVHFYGFSLGGAIAAQVKVLHPESKGKYIGDRSFRSVFSVITENCCITRLGSLIKKITSFISAIFLAYPIYLLGWEWDGSKALVQMKGDMRVIYHPNDCLVPFEASLASKCPPEKQICLNRTMTGAATHFATISQQSTSEDKNAATVVADFLAR